jgi:hypothetical protein
MVGGGWYFFDGERQLGPLSSDELERFLHGQDLSVVRVWREGLSEWVLATDLPELALAGPPPVPTVAGNARGPIAPGVDATKAARFHNFIAMNWRGEFSLATSYWLFGFLGNLFAGILAAVVVAAFQSNSGYQPKSIFLSIALVWTGIVAIAVWQSVGIWRSANRHIKARALLGKKSPWAGLAKVAAFLGILRLVGTFLSSGWPQLLETGRMSFLDDPDIPAYSIRVMRNGTEAEIAGGFKYGLTDDFLKILSASRQIKVVHLDSVGGRIGEAIKLNKVIRSKGLDTYVSSNCMSACTVAFAGGRQRILRSGATLGFHAAFFPGMTKEELAEASRDQRSIFATAGFDKDFVNQALSTPNIEMWKPASSVLLQAKVITSISDGGDFAMSGIGTSLTKDDFGAMLSRALPVMESIKRRFPGDYDSIVQAYYDSFESGKSQVDSIAAGRERLMATLQKLRPIADDTVLSDAAAVYADQYMALGSKDSALCYQYASGIGNTVGPSEIPAALLTRENDVNRRVVETAAVRTTDDPKALDAAWKKVMAGLEKRGFRTEQLVLLSDTNAPAEKYGEYCSVATALFREISKLPGSDAGMVMRDIFAQK